MSHPLDGAKAKLDRADEHLAEIEARVGHYLKSNPIAVDERDERDGRTRHIVWTAIATAEPPFELGLIIGDWVNNVRAALDYTVYELVKRASGNDDPRWTQFPVAIDEARYASQAQDRLRGVPGWALPVFEGLQPFNDGAEAAHHPLAILTDVSNRDKHRLLHTVALEIAGSQARMHGTSMLAIHRIGQNPGVVTAERVILEALIETDGDDFTIELDLQVSVAIEGYELPLVPMLVVVTEEVRAVVDWFAPALDGAA